MAVTSQHKKKIITEPSLDIELKLDMEVADHHLQHIFQTLHIYLFI